MKRPSLGIAGVNPAAVTRVTLRRAGSREYRAKSIPAPKLTGTTGSCMCLEISDVLHRAHITSQNKSPEQGTDLEGGWCRRRDVQGKP